jgi:hypothetical protein
MKHIRWAALIFLLSSCQESFDTKYHLEGMHEWKDAREQHTAKVQDIASLPVRHDLPGDQKLALKHVLKEWDHFALKHQIVYVMIGESLLELFTKGELVSAPIQIFIFPPHFHKLQANPISLKSPGGEKLPQYMASPDFTLYAYQISETTGFQVLFNKGAWNALNSYQFFMPRWGKALGVLRAEEIGKRFWMQAGEVRVFLPQDPYGYLNRTFPTWRSQMKGKKAPQKVVDPSVERLSEKLEPLFEQLTPESVVRALSPLPKVEQTSTPDPSPSPSGSPDPKKEEESQ